MKIKLISSVILLTLAAGLFYFRGSIFPSFQKDTLRLVSNVEATDISPYALSPNGLTRIQNIYEGLVTFDRNLKIVPALAVSWGNLSDTSWEFRLRQGVKFHDGSLFKAQDMVDAWQEAKKSGNSQIASYIETIQDVKDEGDRILITTHYPDPLLLSKLSKIFVHHTENVGTGPYKMDEWIPEKNLALSAFPDYWGPQPDFKKVRYEVMPNRTERERLFKAGDIDLLIGLTEDQALSLPKDQIISAYGLETNFLMFRLNDPLFQDRKVREAVLSLIDPKQIEAIGNHFVKSSNQFIAPGVFGYNPKLPTYTYDPAKEVDNIFGDHLEPLNFDYLETYETLSQYVADQLKKGGFSVNTNAVKPDLLLTKIRGNQSQLFLAGWLAEDGDAQGFFDAFIHSQGIFNHGRYKNAEVDKLIEQSRTEMDPQKRLSLLQQINAKVTADLIGIPLFESSRLYAVNPDVTWEPRLDGGVLGAEVRRK